MSTDAKPKGNNAWALAVDYLPLVAFFFFYKAGGVYVGTATFMGAIVLAVIVSKLKLGRVSPMLWLSAILVLGFGGLTLWLRDERFIQIKVTLIYALFTLVLAGGLLFRKPMLKILLHAAFEGLDDDGWLKLSRNWAIFFAIMGVVNELLRAWFDFGTWLTIKTWGITLASLLFGLANLPMLMRHGLTAAEAKAVEEPLPPQG